MSLRTRNQQNIPTHEKSNANQSTKDQTNRNSCKILITSNYGITDGHHINGYITLQKHSASNWDAFFISQIILFAFLVYFQNGMLNQ